MKKSIHTALIFCLWMAHIALSYAQTNLVPNPGFEEVNIYPPGPELTYCKDWFIASKNAGHLYLHRNNFNPNYRIPLNVYGYQEAYKGNAYAFIPIFNMSSILYTEYFEVKLTKPLEKGVHYNIGLHFNMRNLGYDWYKCAIGDFGIYVSNTRKDTITNDFFYKLKPQIVEQDVNRLQDTANWVEISGEYIAKGGEEYIMIGFF